MAITNYFSVSGRLIAEATDGNRHDYLNDALGSITGTTNQAAVPEKSRRYKPYGAILSSVGSGINSLFGWLGTYGYQSTNLVESDVYVRSRHYSSFAGRWTSRDSLGYYAGLNPFVYAYNRPVVDIDPSGKLPPCSKWGRKTAPAWLEGCYCKPSCQGEDPCENGPLICGCNAPMPFPDIVSLASSVSEGFSFQNSYYTKPPLLPAKVLAAVMACIAEQESSRDPSCWDERVVGKPFAEDNTYGLFQLNYRQFTTYGGGDGGSICDPDMNTASAFRQVYAYCQSEGNLHNSLHTIQEPYRQTKKRKLIASCLVGHGYPAYAALTGNGNDRDYVFVKVMKTTTCK